MKKKIVPGLLLLCVLLLAACGSSLFNVSSTEDNSISITAENALKDSMGIGYLTVGEDQKVLVEPSLDDQGELRLRFMAGLLGSEDFPEEPSLEETISGTEPVEFELEPGEYTVGVTVAKKLTGTAVISVKDAE